ncbi:unnamed protein product [Knipowitschia caucasica]
MSVACVFVMILLGSSVVMAFVLQPSQGDADSASVPETSHQSCQSVSLKTIKQDLLKSLNLQAEPQVPLGLLDSVQEQWRRTFSALPDVAEGAAAASVSVDGCCSMTSEVFMTDLGWNNWVIYPPSLTITTCKQCSREGDTVVCAALSSQASCCRPASHKKVPIVYMDIFGSVVISTVPLTESCGCDSIHK